MKMKSRENTRQIGIDSRLHFTIYCLLILLFVSICCSSGDAQTQSQDQVSAKDQIAAVRDLLHRYIPSIEEFFSLEILSNKTLESYEVESNGVQVILRGTSGVALASAFNWFLNEKCHSQIMWQDQQINVPWPLPIVSPKYVSESPYTFRYYYNTCTFGYSTVWWDWKRWEREIDWMALHGINFPLAFVGQEYVWVQTYEKFGLEFADFSDYFTGPAFLPWQRMGNLYAWMGPLPLSWMEKQRDLQIRILERQRQFGMNPVLPAFAGHVPGAITRVYPSANVTKLPPYDGGVLPPSYFLDPLDPLFSQIGQAFIQIQTQIYGTNHYYNGDPFNEETPPSNDPTYLATVSKTIFQSMSQADPSAVWVLQGWFLHNNPSFWQPAQAKAFLNAVPKDNLLILDLFAEISPHWNVTQSFYDRNFIWCMLHNFGGRSGLYGTLPRVNQGLNDALIKSGTIKGFGLTMEAIETNPVVYDFATDLIWRKTPIDSIDKWIQNYTYRRYGKSIPTVLQAWKLLQDSVYNCNTSQEGPSGNFIVAQPKLKIDRVGCCAPAALFYDPKDVFTAWQNLLNSASLASVNTFQDDLVSITVQVLGNIAIQLHAMIVQGYNTQNTTAIISAGKVLLDLILDADSILNSQVSYLLGVWIHDARAWGDTDAEIAYYELNARTQVTTWGPGLNHLSEYAYKLWAGLVRDYYRPRWSLFIDTLVICVNNNVAFNETQFDLDMVVVEEQWIQSQNTYPIRPTGDTFTISQALFQKYKSFYG
jgi:alpha-N-acetylglucosaminidase